MILESNNLSFQFVGECLALSKGSCPRGDWCSDGGIVWWGWLELLFDVADVLFDRFKVRYKKVGHERVALVVDAIRLEG